MRTGKHVASGDVHAAKVGILICFGIIAVAAVLAAGVLFVSRRSIAMLYTADPVIQDTMVAAFPALCVSIVTSTLQSATAFALNGMSRNHELAVAKLAQPFVLVPVGLYLGYFAPGCGFQAMMWAHPINHVVKFAIMSVMLLRTDWRIHVTQTLVRSESE